MHLFKELYFSVFVLFFRMSGWDGRLKAGTASMCVSTVEGLLALAVWDWVQTKTHHYIALSGWIVAGIFAALFVMNGFIFVTSGYGLEFEQRFHNLSRQRQTALYATSVIIVVTVVISFFVSVSEYHEVFNIRRK
jgi:hypothetical protein